MATADEYEGLPETAGLGTHMAAGALAGISEHVVMYPLDSVKTRMQVLSAPADAAQALRRALTANSARALWRGVWSVILGAGPAHAVHFGTLEAVAALATDAGLDGVPATALAGAAATTAAAGRRGVGGYYVGVAWWWGAEGEGALCKGRQRAAHACSPNAIGDPTPGLPLQKAFPEPGANPYQEDPSPWLWLSILRGGALPTHSWESPLGSLSRTRHSLVFHV